MIKGPSVCTSVDRTEACLRVEMPVTKSIYPPRRINGVAIPVKSWMMKNQSYSLLLDRQELDGEVCICVFGILMMHESSIPTASTMRVPNSRTVGLKLD